METIGHNSKVNVLRLTLLIISSIIVLILSLFIIILAVVLYKKPKHHEESLDRIAKEIDELKKKKK